MFLIEFAIIGALASVIGIIGAWGLSWTILTQGFRLEGLPIEIELVYWFFGGVLLTMISGFLVTRGSIKTLAR